MNEEHFAGLLLEAIGSARASGTGVLIVNVQHDDDCPQLRGGLCQCSPETSMGRVKDQKPSCWMHGGCLASGRQAE